MNFNWRKIFINFVTILAISAAFVLLTIFSLYLVSNAEYKNCLKQNSSSPCDCLQEAENVILSKVPLNEMLNACLYEVNDDFKHANNLYHYAQVAERNEINFDQLVHKYLKEFKDPEKNNVQLLFAYHHWREDYTTAQTHIDALVRFTLSDHQSDPEIVCRLWNNIKSYHEVTVYSHSLNQAALACLKHSFATNNLEQIQAILERDDSKPWPDYKELQLKAKKLKIKSLRVEKEYLKAIQYAAEHNITYPELTTNFRQLFQRAVMKEESYSLPLLYSLNLKLHILTAEEARILALLIAHDQYLAENIEQVNTTLTNNNIPLSEFETNLKIPNLKTLLRLKLLRAMPLEVESS